MCRKVERALNRSFRCGEGLPVEIYDVHRLPEELWPELGRLRLVLVAGICLLALFLAPNARLELMVVLGFCTAGFVAVNLIAQKCPKERRPLIEAISMLFGLGLNTSLVVAGGGAKGTLVFLYLFPVFTYGFRLGGAAAYSSALINSLALLALLAVDWSSLVLSDGLAVGTVIGLMWIEAYAIDYIVRYITSQSEELAQLAWYDPLTGLLNRRALFLEMDRLLGSGVPFTLILLDLDGFKAANDQKGHLFGDEVLKTIAEKMVGVVNGEGKVARYGGDEFAVIAENGKERSQEIAESISQVIDAVGAEYGITLGVSSGLATAPDDAVAKEELLSIADERLYMTKNLHK